MKKGKLLKVISAIMATVLVATSVLFYIDKKSAKASNVTTNKTINNQIQNMVDSYEEQTVKGKSTSKIYKMKIDGKKVTFNVSDTATGRKIVQTCKGSNGYTEINLNNGVMSVTSGEIVDGKYVAKVSDTCNLEEEAQKLAKEEISQNSNRVSCVGLGKSLWYENNDSNINIGKSRFKKDLERKNITLNDLQKDELNNINSYQKYVDKSSKHLEKTKGYFQNMTKAAGSFFLDSIALASFQFLAGFLSNVVVISIFSINVLSIFLSALIYILTTYVLLVYVGATLGAIFYTCDVMKNAIKGIFNGVKAEKAYEKITNLGIAY